MSGFPSNVEIRKKSDIRIVVYMFPIAGKTAGSNRLKFLWSRIGSMGVTWTKKIEY